MASEEVVDGHRLETNTEVFACDGCNVIVAVGAVAVCEAVRTLVDPMRNAWSGPKVRKICYTCALRRFMPVRRPTPHLAT